MLVRSTLPPVDLTEIKSKMNRTHAQYLRHPLSHVTCIHYTYCIPISIRLKVYFYTYSAT